MKPKLCRWCKKKYKKAIKDGLVESCPNCGGSYPEGVGKTVYKDV